MPFSAFMKTPECFLMSASPERFLKKSGNYLISQPIKGTIRRSKDAKQDEALRLALANSEKDKAENLMIVDLVRNDLAKSSVPGSVVVDELFGIYSFEQVHQMISTVRSTIKPALTITDLIKNAFPMGSMTGAPKIRVMEEIDLLEDTARGLYSGAVGYISPTGDFDFNVVIRSVIYSQQSGKLSFHVGSAITVDSDPEIEYAECLLKAEAILKALGISSL
ncbi:MAG: anthranilate synthase component I family protein [Cyclobacteriaceae bacterium]|nr:anthranilate synthase component I family protein [Cyclobacteriaceae bacterium]